MLKRIPITIKVVGLTVVFGLFLWGAIDWVLSIRFKQIFHNQLSSQLDHEADKHINNFSLYVNAYENIKIIVLSKKFNDYLNTATQTEWSAGSFNVKHHTEFPPWLSPPSMFLSLFQFRHALLLDSEYRVREIYQEEGLELPPLLRQPSKRLLMLSNGQSYLTDIDGSPYLIRSEQALNFQREVEASLLLATPIDTDFLVATLGYSPHDNIVALVGGVNPSIVVSSSPHLLPPGTLLNSVQDKFLDFGQRISDYGSSELQLHLTSFVNKEEYESLIQSMLSKVRFYLAIGTAILMFFFMIIIIWIVRNIRQLTNKVMDFSRKRLGIQTYTDKRGDEFSVLERSFQKFIEEVELGRTRMKQDADLLKNERDKLLHSEKLAAIGKLSASIAHEFNNPLYGIQSVIQGIKRNVALDEDYQKLIDLALSECSRVKDLIKNLQDFNKPSSGIKEAVDIHGLLDDMLIMVRKEYKSAHITVQTQYAPDLPKIKIVSDQIKQVFLNLLTNARDAITGESGTVTVITDNLVRQIVVRISDTGSGIAADDLPHIFEPFFTTKSAVKGTGLGLSVSYGIIKSHGGDILVDSIPGKGTTFSILLPLDGETSAQ